MEVENCHSRVSWVNETIERYFLEAISLASMRAGIFLGPLPHVLRRDISQLMAPIRKGDSRDASLGTSTQEGFSALFALAVLGLRGSQMRGKLALADV